MAYVCESAPYVEDAEHADVGAAEHTDGAEQPVSDAEHADVGVAQPTLVFQNTMKSSRNYAMRPPKLTSELL